MTASGGGPAATPTWVPVPEGSDFPIENLPFGIVQPAHKLPRPALRIGDHVVDLSTLAAAGLLEVPAGAVLHHSSLNPLMASGLGPVIRREVTGLLRRPPEGGIEEALLPVEEVDVLLPIAVGDYVDFYSSIHHAENLGRMMRPDAEPLLPNWRHLPVAYHGRAGTIRASGVDVVRPEGLVPDADGVPRLQPTASLDIELEVGFVVGAGGTRIRPDEADRHVFGVVLLNDWSARDIQAFEYQPLGPNLAKSFATTISPWVVTLDALRPYLVPPPVQDPTPDPYLQAQRPWGLDLHLEVWLNGQCLERDQLRPHVLDLRPAAGPHHRQRRHDATGRPLRLGDGQRPDGDRAGQPDRAHLAGRRAHHAGRRHDAHVPTGRRRREPAGLVRRGRPAPHRLRRGHRDRAPHPAPLSVLRWTAWRREAEGGDGVSGSPLWRPDPARAEATHLARFLHHVGQPDYAALHRWSVDQPSEFWAAVWDQCGVIGRRGVEVVVPEHDLPATRFFPDAHLNVAENLLAGWAGDEPAIISHDETGHREECSGSELVRDVAALAAAFEELGVGPGDRVAAWLPNRPEAVITMLAAASLGAVFSSCSPDFGTLGVLDRFGQIEPVVLVAAAGYHYNGAAIDCRPRLAEIRAGLPSVRTTVVVPARAAAADDASGTTAPPDGTIAWDDLLEPHRGRTAPSVRAAPVRPPLVRPLLLRDDRTAQVHRPPRRRRAADAPQGAPAPLRRPPRRPRPLLHDDRLDDVELAGVGAGLGRHDRALRRVTVRAPRRPPLRSRGRGGDQPARRLGQAHRQPGQGRTGAGPHPRAAQPAHDLLHRLAAVARGLPLRVRRT